MNTVYLDSSTSDDVRRDRLYQGQIFSYSNRASILALCEFAAEMLREAFHPLDPLTAQFHLSVERFVEIFGPQKPKFIHHPRTKEIIRNILSEFGCDLDETYQDVPRLRAVTSDAYLTSGVGYAHHPHRDTWYSAPMQQINWWLPIFEMASESSMAFHPQYWNEAVKNGSRELQLLRVEHHGTGVRVAAYKIRYAKAAKARTADGSRPANSLCSRTRRGHSLFGGSDALDCSQYFRKNTVQYRF